MVVKDSLMSVILIVGEQRERGQKCLQSILEQSIIDRIEVILIDCAKPGTPLLMGSNYHRVRIFHWSDDQPYGKVRADAVKVASSPVVAFLEEHCIAMEGWAEALLKAHEEPWGGVCGEVHNGNAGIGISDAVALMNYSPWIAPAPRGESELLPGHNSSYKRKLLLDYGDILPALLRNELILQWKLAERGYKMFLEPNARFAHINETKLGSICKGYYLWSRSFGYTRAEVFAWSRIKKMLRISLSPLIPWIRLARLSVFMVRKRPHQLMYFFRSAPVILICHYFSAIGEIMGILFGIGNSENDFLKYEMNEYRAMANNTI